MVRFDDHCKQVSATVKYYPLTGKIIIWPGSSYFAITEAFDLKAYRVKGSGKV